MLKRTFSFEDLEPPQKRKIPMDEYNSDFRIVASKRRADVRIEVSRNPIIVY